MNVLDNLADGWTVWGHDYFNEDTDSWTRPFPDAFNAAITEVIQRFPRDVIRTNEENTFIFIHNVEGNKVGYQLSGHEKVPETIYADASQVEDVQKIIRNCLWERYKSKSLVMSNDS